MENSGSIDEGTISEICRRVLSAARPDRIILFGSAAKGEMHRDSDIDLLILEQDPKDARAESVRISEALHPLDWPVDVIVMATEWFEASKTVIGGLAYPANKYGRVIYDAA